MHTPDTVERSTVARFSKIYFMSRLKGNSVLQSCLKTELRVRYKLKHKRNTTKQKGIARTRS